MRTWAQSRRLSASASGGWPTTPENACACGTSMRPSRSWVTCASCIWRARSHRPSCWCCIRPWRWSSAWSSKSEVREEKNRKYQTSHYLRVQRETTSIWSQAGYFLHLSHREEPEPKGGVSTEERGREGVRSHDRPAVHAPRFSPQSDGSLKPHGPPPLIVRRWHHHVCNSPNRQTKGVLGFPRYFSHCCVFDSNERRSREHPDVSDFRQRSPPLCRALMEQWNNHLLTPPNRLLMCLKFSCDRQMHCKLQMFCTYSILYIYWLSVL